MTKGVIYVAFGRPYLVMAELSYQTLKKSNPRTPVTIVTNVSRSAAFDGWEESTDTWVFAGDDDSRNRFYKTSICEWTPYERTLYVDCDTLVVGDLRGVFKVLEHADVALLTKDEGLPEDDYGNFRILGGMWTLANLPHWNGGVVAFRRTPSAMEFFRNWSSSYLALGHTRDQPSLAEAVFLTPCRFLSLDSRWNMMSLCRGDWNRSDVKIIHYLSEIDFILERRLLRIARRMGEGTSREFEEYLRRKRLFRKEKLGFTRYLLFKLGQRLRLAFFPPAFWRDLP